MEWPYRHVDLVVGVFANDPVDLVINTRYCKVRIKGKEEQSMERSSALPYTSV